MKPPKCRTCFDGTKIVSSLYQIFPDFFATVLHPISTEPKGMILPSLPHMATTSFSIASHSSCTPLISTSSALRMALLRSKSSCCLSCSCCMAWYCSHKPEQRACLSWFCAALRLFLIASSSATAHVSCSFRACSFLLMCICPRRRSSSRALRTLISPAGVGCAGFDCLDMAK